ncbi:hypothetical protein CkaCkLH20_05241 [Colletotrichum karsti]|uniref:Uncharacterized protein n=1 Tax=Colletotrichum karsti TaxID=1095194 RepID=A0A9P6I9C3_9PEZI|nr:uncharacterized protein CkaCkLH20_05241 [Colletotrichum karsti]KAF9877541.1 hypothetical protein CkaCkLH20_05241 [Colletotrichum karsti]
MSKRPLQDDESSVDETKRRREKSPPAPSFDSPDTTMHKMMDGIESSFQQQSGNGLTGASAFTAANAHTAEDVIAERAKAIRCTIDAISDQLASLRFHLSVNAGQSEAVAECVLLTSQVAEVGKDMRGLLLQNKANRENRDPGTLGL